MKACMALRYTTTAPMCVCFKKLELSFSLRCYVSLLSCVDGIASIPLIFFWTYQRNFREEKMHVLQPSGVSHYSGTLGLHCFFIFLVKLAPFNPFCCKKYFLPMMCAGKPIFYLWIPCFHIFFQIFLVIFSESMFWSTRQRFFRPQIRVSYLLYKTIASVSTYAEKWPELQVWKPRTEKCNKKPSAVSCTSNRFSFVFQLIKLTFHFLHLFLNLQTSQLPE